MSEALPPRLTSRERLTRALDSQPVDGPPVWMMRQAGRTLPEYRALRAKHSFVEVMKTPDLATEVTLQPLRRFPFDAAILFSDILNVPEAMGQHMELVKGTGPVLDPVVRTAADVDRLRALTVEDDLAYVGDTLRQLRGELGDDRGLLGFAGAPFTLAVYMVEGRGTKSFSKIKGLFWQHPDVAHALMDRLAIAVSQLLQFQLASGADGVQLFDTWAGVLSPADYLRFAHPYNQRILSEVRATGGRVLMYAKNGAHLLDALVDTEASGLALDWRTDLGAVARRLAAEGRGRCVQGNLDPIELFAPRAHIRERVRALHAAVEQASAGGSRVGHVMNLGHGVVPDTPIDGIAAFAEETVALREGA